MSNATKTTHKISVKSFNQVYVNIEETGGVEEISKDKTVLITPNPVNPGETVTISGAENYQIYNLAGALVAEGNGDTFTAPAASGIYIVKFGSQSQKMIVK